MYLSKNHFQLIKHPFKTFVGPACKTLIVGTFPAHKRLFEFYYGGEQNRFWDALSHVFNHKFKFFEGEAAKLERRAFALNNGLGFTDMLDICYRKNKSSSDENLYPVMFNNILLLLRNNKQITTVMFTSRTEAVGALGLFKIFLMQQEIPIPEFSLMSNKTLYSKIQVDERNVELYVPYSPSARLESLPLSRLVEMYKYVLNDL